MKAFILVLAIFSSLTFASPFRDRIHTFNRDFEFQIYGTALFYKPLHAPNSAYREIILPAEMKTPRELSVDGEILIVTDEKKRIFYSEEAMAPKENLNWRLTWGFPFAKGPWMSLPSNTLAWDISFVSPKYDEYYVGKSGNHYRLGQGCTTLFILRGEGDQITYIDPWLPSDYSYEACAPRKGRFKSVALSSSGSTLFVIGKNGDMFTRNYDFDLVGADTLFFKYTFEPVPFYPQYAGKVMPNSVPKELPLADWMRQPKIKGEITDRISISKNGVGLVKKTLAVEGVNEKGESGYFTKDVNDSKWTFVETNLPIEGNYLQNRIEAESEADLAPSKGMNFQGVVKPFLPKLFRKVSFQVMDFNPYCSPATLRVTFQNRESIDLTLHSREGIRMARRAEGISDKDWLPLLGTIEIPNELWNKRSSHIEELISDVFHMKTRFMEVKLEVKKSAVKISNFKMGGVTLERK